MGRKAIRLAVVVCILAGASLASYRYGSEAASAAGSDWSRYLRGPQSSGFTPENIITASNASLLKAQSGWPVHETAGPVISTQPVTANGNVYFGAWDGYMHAIPAGGNHDKWATFLGRADSTDCGTVGIASTATVYPMQIGTTTSVLFVGAGGTRAGGDAADMFALDAFTGQILWRTPLGPFPNNFMWSSPVVYTPPGATSPSVYQGLSALGDCPLVQGKVFKLDAATGAIQSEFDVVPNGCIGGSVWGSPTVDLSDGSIYVTTGNPDDSCPVPETYTYAILKLRSSDLSLEDYWQVPRSEQFEDVDFGATPTLFKGTVTPTGAMRNLVGAVNKNGTYYVFDRTNLHAGPVARLKSADNPRVCGSACPEGVVSVAPSAWDGSTLYVPGITLTIKGVQYPGNLTAWNPNNLASPKWQDGLLQGHILAAATAAPGIVVVGAGSSLLVVRSSDGTILFTGRANGFTSNNPAIFWGAASISHGVLYVGDTHGYMYAYSVLGK